MELASRYLARYPSHFAAYVALQRAFIRHHVSRGGTAEDFCARLAPVFRRRFEPVFFGAGQVREAGPAERTPAA